MVKICIDCGCLMQDDHEGDVCECCLDDRGDTLSDGLRDEREKTRLEWLASDNPCLAARCSWNDSDLGCTCPSGEEWYQCPLEPEPEWDAIMSESEAGK